ISLDGVAGTLQVGREHFDERLGILTSSLAQLRAQLASFIDGSSDATLYRGKVVRGDQVLSLFDGDELRDTVSRWAARGQYDKLLALWVKGGDIDWAMLQAASGVALRRVSLPGYPFARERHWPSPSLSPAAVTPAAAERSIAYLKKSWTPAPAQPCEDMALGQALILASDVTMSLARLLAPQVNGVIVNLDDASSSHRTMEISFVGAIDITGCALEAPGPLALLPWLQQLVAQPSPGLLLGVTRGLESFDNDSMHLAGAASAGLYRMLHSEYARLRSRHLDLDARDDEATRARQIVNEWLSAGDDAQVSYRKGLRHTARLEEIVAPSSTSSLVFDPASVLWVSGGTRGIGLLCARHFVTHHQVRKLVLTGRQALPPEQDWDRCLASDTPQDVGLARKIATVRALREQGVQVEVLALADTAPQVVAEALQRVVRSMGPIGGVLHCAGINDMDTPAFIRKSSEGFGAVLAPKVAGLDALLAAVRGQPLRFMALFSSVAATVPALAAGQSDYACANAYMDYVAEAHAAYGAALPIISIQWPSWKETGMGEAGTRAYRDSGMLSHTDAEGLHMLDTVLASRCGPVVLPAVVDRTRWQPQRLMQRSLSRADASPPASPVAAVKAMVAGTDGLAGATLGWLAQLFSKELMVAPATLDPHTPFQDYGVDSIMLTQILRRVDTALAAHGKQQALDPSIFYEHPTLAAFAAHLQQSCPAALEGVLASSGQPQPQPQSQSPSQAPQQPQSRPVAAPKNTAQGSDIAVIGMACSLPGAADLDAYWRLLAEGRSAIGPVPVTRWQHDGDHYAGLLGNVDSFDARYFLLDERDASAMDPQALLLLEQTLAALHHAGYSASDIKGSATGVYIGARSGHRPAAEALRQARNPIVAVGQNYLAANISQFFDLQGPSLVLDTACSSALVAMHMALRALQGGEISAALVGGVSLLASGDAHRLFGSRKLLSAGGEFHLFDQRAGGVVLGEGAGMVMLKPLQQALDDGDRVHAVIKGLAINNDGRTAGPATPNLLAQKAVMRAALAASGVPPEQVGYIHANGSGSEVTDLLELKATEAVYRAQADTPCELGSVEPNIGHPLCAKGIAGFIAVVLMLAQRQRVPFLSGQQAMAHYDMAVSPFHFGRVLERWQDGAPCAALSCFADGGTNAHVILAPWNGAASDQSQRPQRQPLPMPALERRRIGGAEVAAAWPQCPDSGHLLLTDQHPIVRGHQAYGQQLLPGLAYIDIVFQHFERLGYPLPELELCNLSIYQPLIVSAGHHVLLEVRCLEQAGGQWQVELEGSDPAADASQPRQRYATAEMHRAAPAVFADRLDLAQVRRDAASTLDLAQMYAQCSRQGLQHDGAIRAVGQVHETAQATYIEIEVGADALAGASAYRFHPALIDGCSVGAQRLFAAFFEGEARLILPLFYASFRASAPLTARCIARIAADTLRRKNELLYMDIEFFDYAG
ncbi:MAG: beta-ketoacyl synthase N-terminal-like domain-containing protein, partial [Duganella sp.]